MLATSAALMEMEYFDHDASGVFVSSSSMSIPHADKSLIQMPSFSYDSDLAFKLTGDILVAVSITFGVSPILSVIDKAIVQKAAGTHSILQSSLDTTVNIARNPGNFIKSPVFLAMWGVYAATYSIANCLKTMVEHNEQVRIQNIQDRHFNSKNSMSESSESSYGMTKFGVFAATTAVNSSTTMLKDKFYAKHFGTATAAVKVPMITYGLWSLRDCMVIGSSFILPDIMSGILQEHSELDKKSALRISQFACPIVAQFAAGPVQLLALDIYNRPLHSMTFQQMASERIRFQVQNFGAIVGARIARIAPAYGVGGIGNTYFRDKWRDRVLKKDW